MPLAALLEAVKGQLAKCVGEYNVPGSAVPLPADDPTAQRIGVPEGTLGKMYQVLLALVHLWSGHLREQ